MSSGIRILDFPKVIISVFEKILVFKATVSEEVVFEDMFGDIVLQGKQLVKKLLTLHPLLVLSRSNQLYGSKTFAHRAAVWCIASHGFASNSIFGVNLHGFFCITVCDALQGLARWLGYLDDTIQANYSGLCVGQASPSTWDKWIPSR
jgi:hypothetical protein